MIVNNRNSLSFFIAIILLVAAQGVVADEWDDADKAIKRLSPTAFYGLPDNIVKELKKRGCTIPQIYLYKEPHNIISGEFAKKGQKDWAVLCSKNRSSSILVFWGGTSSCPSEFSASKDSGWLQGTGNGIGYSRGIGPVGKEYIMVHFKRYGGNTPPLIRHQGIDDAFVGKGSTVRYCHKGKWIQLTGAD